MSFKTINIAFISGYFVFFCCLNAIIPIVMTRFEVYFEQLYISYYAKLKRFACEYVVSEADAENIIHDIFTELWVKRDVFLLSTNKVAFLFTSVRNRCLDHLRRQAVEQRTTSQLQQDYVLTMQMKLNSLEVLDEHVFAEYSIEDIITRAIASLPEKCRIIFIKSKIEGKRQKEIAQELGISIHTVETQMGIAYKKLKEDLRSLFPLFIVLFSLSCLRLSGFSERFNVSLANRTAALVEQRTTVGQAV